MATLQPAAPGRRTPLCPPCPALPHARRWTARRSRRKSGTRRARSVTAPSPAVRGGWRSLLRGVAAQHGGGAAEAAAGACAALPLVTRCLLARPSTPPTPHSAQPTTAARWARCWCMTSPSRPRLRTWSGGSRSCATTQTQTSSSCWWAGAALLLPRSSVGPARQVPAGQPPWRSPKAALPSPRPAPLQVGNKSDLRHLRSVQTEDAKVRRTHTNVGARQSGGACGAGQGRAGVRAAGRDEQPRRGVMRCDGMPCTLAQYRRQRCRPVPPSPPCPHLPPAPPHHRRPSASARGCRSSRPPPWRPPTWSRRAAAHGSGASGRRRQPA